MQTKKIFELRKTKCRECGAEGLEVVGDYESWHNIALQPFSEFVKEELRKGRNIVHEYGCAKCFNLDLL